ncbi:type II toxin-antitoxin system prevent-host-death family antitoxin [Rhizobium sp. 3T7]|uniref:type II toxin-antitoxin system Phd/YefM family antitoxin n=1 Tax=Rhizobium sp. 3T7 TaxID=2874922 RepID=UPI001CCE6F6E|nr:type II toxin-antitoxin system prevent-host-death family antitoxin [Rhizobium sp. 3T7]MBZ9791857.1 type II toxin-antitoxin system prevent-host-death family antitoxin [Rhizobium sp. 3T7]
MTIKVKVAEAKTCLSEHLTQVEAGQENEISRGSVPVARLSKVDDRNERAQAFRLLRIERAERAKASAAEIQQWRLEGQR